MNISTSLKAWQRIDADAASRIKNGEKTIDHKKSVGTNIEAARDTFSGVGQAWQSVLQGKAVLGGGNPRDRVKQAHGALAKLGTATTEHGGNALLAAAITVTGATGGVVDYTHALTHAFLGAFQRD